MRRFRKTLMIIMTLAMFGFGALIGVNVVNASGTANISYDGIKAGTKVLWQPANNQSGYNLTGGGTQKLRIYMTQEGNKINAGLCRMSNHNNLSMYNGTVSGKKTNELSKTITDSGYYKPYVKNNNSTVSLTVTSSSYFKYD